MTAGQGRPTLETDLSDDKIINLGKRIPWEQNVKNLARHAAAELRASIHYRQEAEKSLKAMYDCLSDDSVLAQYEAEFGVTGIMNVIYAAFPDRPPETLEAMLKDA